MGACPELPVKDRGAADATSTATGTFYIAEDRTWGSHCMLSSSGLMKLSALAIAMNTSSFTRSGTPCAANVRDHILVSSCLLVAARRAQETLQESIE